MLVILYYKFPSDDWIEIYDGGNVSATMIGNRLCGKTHPTEIASSGNEMVLKFHTSDCDPFCASGYTINAAIGKSDFISKFLKLFMKPIIKIFWSVYF